MVTFHEGHKGMGSKSDLGIRGTDHQFDGFEKSGLHFRSGRVGGLIN